MTASPQQPARSYRLSFIINMSVGALLLLLAAIGFMAERAHPSLRGGGLVWGFLPGAVICFTIAMIHRGKYLSLSK